MGRGESLGSRAEDLSPPTMLQASRKAGTRGKAAATKQAQRGSSNVFSMFEQAQIQEFKEVSAPPPMAWDRSRHPTPHTPPLLCSQWSWPLSLLRRLPSRTPPHLRPSLGWGLFPLGGCAPHFAGLQLHRPKPGWHYLQVRPSGDLLPAR